LKYLSSLNLKTSHKRIRLEMCPIVAYDKLYLDDPYSFLYESLESKGKRGRFSFVGGKPFLILKSYGQDISIQYHDQLYQEKGNPFTVLRALVNGRRTGAQVLPFAGGAVGYVSYDAIRFIENIPDNNPDKMHVPDTYFMFPSEVIVFDHQEKTVDVISYTEEGGYKQIDAIEVSLRALDRSTIRKIPKGNGYSLPFESNFTPQDYGDIVKKAREYIKAGDVFQVVLSQRFGFPLDVHPFTVYSALRRTNPSPYMYYLNLDGLTIAGSSPEILVKVKDKRVTTRPLAGTRPRGHNEQEDQAFENDLLSDDKEKAEHVMLVDLARNDIGRVCDYGTVHVDDMMTIERYSKVMHIVSNVEGRLRQDCDAFDVFEASFPAGTVSGAPKVRSMEIIDELETLRRGIYAGSIGYFDFSGNMDMCIAIRNIIMLKNRGYIQAGAGIVADSQPDKEYQETRNKAKALMHAIEMVSGHNKAT